jgi:hypothetical protein
MSAEGTMLETGNFAVDAQDVKNATAPMMRKFLIFVIFGFLSFLLHGQFIVSVVLPLAITATALRSAGHLKNVLPGTADD